MASKPAKVVGSIKQSGRQQFCEAFEGSDSNRLKALEGARGLAMVLVFVIHLHEFLVGVAKPDDVSGQLVAFLYTVGNLAGDFFLVITGCFVYRSVLHKPVSYVDYVQRRLGRIYPVFLCVLSMYVLLSIAFPESSKLPADPFAAVVYVLENAALLPGLLPVRPMMSVAWTLSYIVFYYLTIPLVVNATGMRRWRPWQRVTFFAVALFVSPLINLARDFVPLRLNMLIVGALLAEALDWRSRLQPPQWMIQTISLVVLVSIALRYCIVQWRHISVFDVARTPLQLGITAAGLFCFCYCIVDSRWKFNAILIWRPLRWLGNMSYSYYLGHSLAIKLFSVTIDDGIALVAKTTLGFWTIQPLLFALSLPPCILLYLAIEKGWLIQWLATPDAPLNATARSPRTRVDRPQQDPVAYLQSPQAEIHS